MKVMISLVLILGAMVSQQVRAGCAPLVDPTPQPSHLAECPHLPDDRVPAKAADRARVIFLDASGDPMFRFPCTASLFHAGWDGHATMELGNLGVMPVALYPRMRICMFTFERMSSPVENPYGSKTNKYQGQSGPMPSHVWDELEEELQDEELRKGRQAGLFVKDEGP